MGRRDGSRGGLSRGFGGLLGGGGGRPGGGGRLPGGFRRGGCGSRGLVDGGLGGLGGGRPGLDRRSRVAGGLGSGLCGGYDGSARTMPAATVFDVASSIRMKLPVVRLRA